MSKSTAAALLRNRRKQGLTAFITSLEASTRVHLDEGHFVDPDVSIRLAAAIENLGALARQGRIQRVPELTWPESESRLRQFVNVVSQRPCLVVLCHFTDYVFHSQFLAFSSQAKQLLDFDGDNVLAVSNDFSCGIGIDRYISELSGERRFTIDSWFDSVITPI